MGLHAARTHRRAKGQPTKSTMGAGASAIPVDQLTDPKERALYNKLKAQYDEEVESCETDTAKAMLMKK